jgi:uncharacterized protein YbcI
MSVPSHQDGPPGGLLYTAISNAIVAILRDYSGHGPTQARTTIRDNMVVVVLHNALTRGERSLLANGRGDKVLDIRHEFQEAMRDDCTAKVSELTGRGVIAMMSANHIDPDLAVEIFILDGAPNYDLASAA